jgi:ubiquinone/menaquinone biosynthesis C-methylase UbiE
MATETDAAPERLDVGDRDARLIVAEHRGRYLWAAPLAHEQKVLDAGCGTGYGLTILKDAGATRIVGVDISAEAVATASKAGDGERVEVVQGDVAALPFADGEFDLVVCFEVIEHVEDRDTVLDELSRVLGPEGILCISTPNRLVYPPGNPHHIHEYEPEEFDQALAQRFTRVTLYRQAAWLASALLSDGEFATEGSDQPFSSLIAKTVPKAPGEEVFTVAVASQRETPPQRALLSLAEPFEVSWWQQQVQAAQEEATAYRRQALTEVLAQRRETAVAQGDALRERESSHISARRVLEVEESLAQAQARIFAVEEALDSRTTLADELHERVKRADRVMAAMKASVSWRITAPLRALKRLR